MTKIDPMMTLGALVNSHPKLARELERRGLDYCCGGGQTLFDACSSKGIDSTLTAMELAAVVSEEVAKDWSTMEAVELVNHLESTHHRYLWEELPRLSALMVKIVSAHGERHPELHAIAACYEKVRADLEPHLTKEERVLFPMIRELAVAQSVPSFHCGTLRNPISMMLREHDAVGELLAQLRQLTDGYQVPADGCPSYKACFAGLVELEADTHLHIHKENNLLFPMVVRMESELALASRPGEIVTAFIAAVEAKDLDTALGLVTDDVSYENVPIAPIIGKSAMRATLDTFLKAATQVEWRMLRQVVSDRVVINERLDRFQIGDGWLELPIAGFFEVTDEGLISVWRDYFDMSTYARQFAALTKPK